MRQYLLRLLFLKTIFFTALILSASTGVDADVQRVIVSINQLRIQNGFAALDIDHEAGVTARNHANELALRLNLSHIGIDGLRVAERYRIAGGTGLKAGENLGAGDTVDLIIDAWMDSPGHRRNILESKWTAIGVGLHILESGRIIAVVVFTDARWKLLNHSINPDSLELTGELLINPGRFPEAVLLRHNGNDFSPVSVKKKDPRHLILRFTVPIPYQWHRNQSAAFRFVIVEEGINIPQDLLIIPAR